MKPRDSLKYLPYLFFFFALALATGAPEQVESAKPVRVRKIYTAPRPDSLVRGFEGNLFVSVAGGTEPGDGEVRVIRGIETYTFARGLDEPSGMAFAGGRLLVVDGARVMSLDAGGALEVFCEWTDFPVRTKLLRRLAVSGEDGTVFVSDAGDLTEIPEDYTPDWWNGKGGAAVFPDGRIFSKSLGLDVDVEIEGDTALLSPSGLLWDPERGLVACSYLDGGIYACKAGRVGWLARGERGVDTIVRDSKGGYYFSSWSAGEVWRVEPESGRKTLFYSKLAGAAGLCIDEEAGWIYVVDPKSAAVHRVPIEDQWRFVRETSIK